jgi:hypothetical protein
MKENIEYVSICASAKILDLPASVSYHTSQNANYIPFDKTIPEDPPIMRIYPRTGQLLYALSITYYNVCVLSV